MSNAVLKGHASGTGTVTIETPNTNSDLTISVPARAGNMAVDGPAFSAYMANNQILSNGSYTKLQYNTESWDTNSNYDTSLFRFTPTVAGYYQFNFTMGLYSATSLGTRFILLYKNGAAHKYGNYLDMTAGTGGVITGSTQVYMNGSTDYVEIYGYVSSGGTNTIQGIAAQSYFEGCLMRAA